MSPLPPAAGQRRRPRIAIVAPAAFGAVTGGEHGHLGGVERQAALIGRWLAHRAWDVRVIAWDEGQPEGLDVCGVRIHKMCSREAGLPGLRFLWPRWSSLERALARADADVCYQTPAEYVTGQVALWCRRRGRAFVYAASSDPDCDPRLPQQRTRRERWLYRYGLTRADLTIVQTRRQQAMLADGFGLAARVLPMPCVGPTDHLRAQAPGPGEQARVLWVGRIARVKRLEMLLELAGGHPEVRFDVAGPLDDDAAYTQPLLAAARALPNVTLHGRVAPERLGALYASAHSLLCTSHFEGFPNTFLEAWSRGLPVVSTVDPDQLIERCGLGVVAPDSQSLAGGLLGLLASPSRWRAASEACRLRFVHEHAVEAAMPRLESALLEVLEARQTGRAGAEHKPATVSAGGDRPPLGV